ncbi:fused MFS/spermidine synthase [Luedemannella helvata]|uniref:Fused MFS/spermidine synthase n=1 Tax=Luedemannella helvata TaxID=349315 RepID=A0ABP4X7H8_9ACTN
MKRERVVEQVASGTAELVPDHERRSGWTLLVDGVPQSYVDLDDPRHLEFEYVRRLAAAVDAVAPAGEPLRVLHLGGGAFTVPRYVAATRPGSGQLVVERDAALAALVRRVLPLPRRGGIRVREGDARAVVEALPDNRFDLVIGDVYAGAQMPRTVASVEFATEVARVLSPTGWYAVNVADLPPLAFSRIQAATLAAAFPDVAVLAEPGMLRGRRYGNVALVAAAAPGGLPVARLAAAARRDPFPGRLLHGSDLATFVAGARPMRDEAARDSPAPPRSIFL